MLLNDKASTYLRVTEVNMYLFIPHIQDVVDVLMYVQYRAKAYFLKKYSLKLMIITVATN